MDLASGIFASLSISVTLIKTVKETRAFYKNVKKAPEEVLRLVGTLNRLELILTQTSIFLEERSKCLDLPGSVISIRLCMEGLKCTVEKLESIVKRIETQFARPGRSNGVFTSVRTVVKLDEIETLRQLVHEDMSTLQAAILIDVSQIQ